MPRPHGSHDDFRLQADFVNADVTAALHLLSLAEAESLVGAFGNTEQAMREAERRYQDGHYRLLACSESDARPLRPKLANLRSAIEFYSIVLKTDVLKT